MTTGWNKFVKSIEPSVRTGNVLDRMGINTIEGFMALTPEQIQDQRGAGRKTVSEITHMQSYFKKLGHQPRDLVDETKHNILMTLEEANLSPRLALGLLEEIKFIIYARM